MIYVKFGNNRLNGFREDVIWKCWRADGRRRMPAYTISDKLTYELPDQAIVCIIERKVVNLRITLTTLFLEKPPRQFTST